jgi:antitoxin component YwqK of YwqJK toxin-antitoxin module
MKSKMKYLFFLLIGFSALAQADFNKVDANGKKHGLWKGIYEESKRPRYEGTFEHGIETGTFKYFDDTKAGTVIATRVFSDNGKAAYTTLLDRKGFIVSEGKTVNRQNEGEWKYYQEESKELMTQEFYINGKLNGVRKVFFIGGNIAEEATYKNGAKNGSYKKYTEKGIVLEESNFKDGKYDGLAVFRDSEGRLSSKGPFVNGEKKGMWEFYVDGKLKEKKKLPEVKKRIQTVTKKK